MRGIGVRIVYPGCRGAEATTDLATWSAAAGQAIHAVEDRDRRAIGGFPLGTYRNGPIVDWSTTFFERCRWRRTLRSGNLWEINFPLISAYSRKSIADFDRWKVRQKSRRNPQLFLRVRFFASIGCFRQKTFFPNVRWTLPMLTPRHTTPVDHRRFPQRFEKFLRKT